MKQSVQYATHEDTDRLNGLKYHLKFGWFRYLLSYVLLLVLAMPFFYLVIFPFTLMAFAYFNVGVTGLAVLAISIGGIITATIVSTLPIRHITKGYIHYRYRQDDDVAKKKRFRKHQYGVVVPCMFFVMMATIFAVVTFR